MVALAAVLRVATGLDRSHGARVASTSVDWSDDRVVITLHPAGTEPVELEAHAAGQRSGLLQDLLGRAVVVRAGVPARTA